MSGWIIPARAGFTGEESLRGPHFGDHPRSRGVYLSMITGVELAGGSSPLARGLQARLIGPIPDHGIIPARAGFTGRRQSHTPPPRDHPRSRGVYILSAIFLNGLDGSSPLARGLRPRHHPQLDPRRIIPARAGFTDHCAQQAEEDRDHPRSRGVYVASAWKCAVITGSSPLARGLRFRDIIADGRNGIIPARAGFTDPHDYAIAEDLGSSPLARGLHVMRERPLPYGGDHPRSRGVYEWWGLLRAGIFGSSPLARGLRGLAGRLRKCFRIIPARAGFTFAAF